MQQKEQRLTLKFEKKIREKSVEKKMKLVALESTFFITSNIINILYSPISSFFFFLKKKALVFLFLQYLPLIFLGVA